MKFNLSDLKHTINLNLLARQLVEGFITGLHKSPYHGFSVEFSEHRLYNQGESTRHIDWKVYARTDKLFTKQYTEETNLRCMLILDTSPSMYYPVKDFGKIRFSVYAAAALTYLIQSQRDAIGLCTFTDSIQTITPVRSAASHRDKIFVELEKIIMLSENKKKSETSKTEISNVLHEIAEKIHKRSLVILFSDLYDAAENPNELFKALQHLVHKRHEVVVFHVTDNATEYTFNFDNRPAEFIDLETGERLKINPEEVRSNYQHIAAQFYKSLKLQCQQFKIDFVEVDAADSVQSVLQSYLIKRAKMK